MDYKLAYKRLAVWSAVFVAYVVVPLRWYYSGPTKGLEIYCLFLVITFMAAMGMTIWDVLMEPIHRELRLCDQELSKCEKLRIDIELDRLRERFNSDD